MIDTHIRNVMFDLASRREMFDEALGRNITNAEADDAIRRVCFETLGLSATSSDKQIRRALSKDSAIALFEIIEEIVDVRINYGLGEDNFFNQFVETRNLKDGDANEFWAESDILLNVTKVSGSHHDLSIQTLGEGEAYTVPTSYYGVRVGNDIRLFLTGKKNWSQFIDAVSRAYINKMATEVAAQFVNGTNLIAAPSVLSGTGAFSSTTKPKFDEIIEKVESANNAPVAIMGTKTALKNLNLLAGVGGVDWVSASQKESVAATGFLGSYEGTKLIQIPQKFADKSLTTAIVPANKLFVMPLVDDEKPIKLVDYGETEFTKEQIGDTMDDLQTYEVQRRFGVGTLMTRYHGVWTL